MRVSIRRHPSIFWVFGFCGGKGLIIRLSPISRSRWKDRNQAGLLLPVHEEGRQKKRRVSVTEIHPSLRQTVYFLKFPSSPATLICWLLSGREETEIVPILFSYGRFLERFVVQTEVHSLKCWYRFRATVMHLVEPTEALLFEIIMYMLLRITAR